MYCDKCGAENAESAKFCRKCGEVITLPTPSFVESEENGEVETRVAARAVEPLDQQTKSANDEERQIFSITPTLLFVKVGYVAAAIVALLFVALMSILLGGVSAIIWIVVALAFFLVPAYFHIKQRLTRYTLTETKVEIDSGLIARTTRNIPIRRIQDVTVTANVFQRLVGYGDLVIDNASEAGSTIILDNIDRPQEHADMLLKQMRLLEK
ncbi:MAG TPA: PH domain-containing protein [Pyrinomonadaceae bacterium]|nr:PH domain-containing protein [Pyrinomonadaceae bacterium]